MDEFLNTATLAGTEFVAERLNIKVVSTANYTGLPSEEETARAKKAEEENRQYLGIPRRFVATEPCSEWPHMLAGLALQTALGQVHYSRGTREQRERLLPRMEEELG